MANKNVPSPCDRRGLNTNHEEKLMSKTQVSDRTMDAYGIPRENPHQCDRCLTTSTGLQFAYFPSFNTVAQMCATCAEVCDDVRAHNHSLFAVQPARDCPACEQLVHLAEV